MWKEEELESFWKPKKVCLEEFHKLRATCIKQQSLLNRALLVAEQKEIVTGEAEDKIEVPVAAHYSVAILPVVFSPGLQASSKDIFSIKKTRSEKSFNLTHSNNVMLI